MALPCLWLLCLLLPLAVPSHALYVFRPLELDELLALRESAARQDEEELASRWLSLRQAILERQQQQEEDGDEERSSPVLALLMEDDPLETGAAPEDEEEAEELVLLQRHPTVFLLE